MSDTDQQRQDRAREVAHGLLDGGAKWVATSMANCWTVHGGNVARTELCNRLTAHEVARLGADEAHAVEVERLRGELAEASRDARQTSEQLDFERGRYMRLDAEWRAQWDATIGKVARGEALLQPAPSFIVTDPGGFLANVTKERDAAQSEAAKLRALANARTRCGAACPHCAERGDVPVELRGLCGTCSLACGVRLCACYSAEAPATPVAPAAEPAPEPKEKCETCGGLGATGRYDAYKCPTCGGTGERPTAGTGGRR